jgi:hypothetical protein
MAMPDTAELYASIRDPILRAPIAAAVSLYHPVLPPVRP